MTVNTNATERVSRARIIYDDRAVTVFLKHDATFSDLAGCLARIEKRLGRKPIAVDVRLAM